MPTATTLGQTGLQGWREKVADGIAEPVAQRAPLDADQVRAALGALFLRSLGDVHRQDCEGRDARGATELRGPSGLGTPGRPRGRMVTEAPSRHDAQRSG